MLIDIPKRGQHLLGYELNVHPGNNLAQLKRSIERFTLPIRDRLHATTAFGIAPRFGAKLLDELSSAKSRRELRAWLEDHGLVPYSANGFPLQDFHARRVKAAVYAPPWPDRQRLTYTRRGLDVLASLLPEGSLGSLSTLGGTYRPWGNDPRSHHRIGLNYLRAVCHLLRTEHRTGRFLQLTVEPEPDTTFESAADVIALYENHMLPHVSAEIARPLGLSRSKAEEELRRVFAVNLDICHQSVLFRDPVREWRALERKGLRVGKLHITSALELRRPGRSSEGRRQLQQYDEPRYLHQFAVGAGRGFVGARGDDRRLITRGADLDELARVDLPADASVRVHFHVPVSLRRMGALWTTRDDTEHTLRFARRRRELPHLVVETYTWPQISDGSQDDIVGGIVRELRWTKRILCGMRDTDQVA